MGRFSVDLEVANYEDLVLAKRGGMKAEDVRRTTVRGVGAVHVTLLGRSGSFTAAVEPKRTSVLIGAVVLEDLDFLVDPLHARLEPRDPRMIVSELE